MDEGKIDVKAEDVAYGNEVKDAVVSVKINLEQDFAGATATGDQLWVDVWRSPKKGGLSPRMHQRAEFATGQD